MEQHYKGNKPAREGQPHNSTHMERSAFLQSLLIIVPVFVATTWILGRLNWFDLSLCWYVKGNLNLQGRKGSQELKMSKTCPPKSPGNSLTSCKTQHGHCFRGKVFGDFCESFPQVLSDRHSLLLVSAQPESILPGPRDSEWGESGLTAGSGRVGGCGGWNTQKRLLVFDSSFDYLALSRADDKLSFLWEDWQGEVAALSLLAGGIIDVFTFQKVIPGHHALFG